MSVLIQTKYHPATNIRGPRITARLHGDGQSVRVSYPPELSDVECYDYARKALCDKLKITHKEWVHGYFPGGYIFISTDKPE